MANETAIPPPETLRISSVKTIAVSGHSCLVRCHQSVKTAYEMPEGDDPLSDRRTNGETSSINCQPAASR